MSTDRQLPTHFGLIDAMRGVAAICVVIFHYTGFYFAHAGQPEIPVAVENVPYAALLTPIYLHGEDFVRLFWVISGFVFAHVYWGRPTNGREFVVARFARLYPLHAVTLVIVAVLQTASMHFAGHWQVFGNNDPFHFILQIFMMDSALNLSDGTSFNGPIWSVSAEILIYMLFFLTLPLTKRSPIPASILLAALSFVILNARPDWFIIGRWTFTCGVFFFAGSACYAIYREVSRKGLWLVFAAVGLAALAAYRLENDDMTLLAVCCFTVMGLAALERMIPRRGRILKGLGDISYSVYLVHMPIQIAVLLAADTIFEGDRSFADNAASLPLFLGVSIWVAYLTNTYFEKPVGAWLRQKLLTKPHT